MEREDTQTSKRKNIVKKAVNENAIDIIFCKPADFTEMVAEEDCIMRNIKKQKLNSILTIKSLGADAYVDCNQLENILLSLYVERLFIRKYALQEAVFIKIKQICHENDVELILLNW